MGTGLSKEVMGMAGDKSENQDGGQSPSKTGGEEFRIQEMWRFFGTQWVWPTGSGESVGSAHRKGRGQDRLGEGLEPGMRTDHR